MQPPIVVIYRRGEGNLPPIQPPENAESKGIK